jgi:pimeloyl-ACP methyl ester carboxylesterase
MLEDSTFDSAGVTIRYVQRGQGEPVVLVHSYAGDLESQWTATGVLDALTRDFRVIAFDARGHGRSGKPHAPRAYGREMTLDIARLLDHLDIARAHIIGYSMGAHLVAQLLALAAQRFITATLGGGCGRREWTAAHACQAEIEAAEMERGSLESQMLRLGATGRAAPTRELIERSSAAFLAGKDCLALAAVRRSNSDQLVTVAQLAAANVPVLGIAGSADPYLASYDELMRVMPSLQMCVIEGATHAAAAARPEFVEAILRFLRAQKSVVAPQFVDGASTRHTPSAL